MAKEDKPSGFKPWRDLANYGALSLNLGMLMLGGYFVGRQLDSKLHTSPRWMIVGALVGMLLGLWTLFEVAAKLVRKDGRK